jgi:DNA-directed RNA polymerase subunit RPC12/RpoP
MVERVSSTAEVARFVFKCDKCGEKLEEVLARLVDVDGFPCGRCGHRVNLKAGQNRFRLQKLKEECARWDAALREAGNP